VFPTEKVGFGSHEQITIQQERSLKRCTVMIAQRPGPKVNTTWR